MYGNQINKKAISGYIKLAKGAYRRKDTSVKDKGGLFYIEGRSGEYDARERGLISDPYADGWAIAEAGGQVEAYELPKFCHAAKKAEIMRLLVMGFNDCKELEGEKK